MKHITESELCLITYFVLLGIDTEAADRQLRAEGLTVEQVEDIWETKVKDVDILTWIILTNGRTKPEGMEACNDNKP